MTKNELQPERKNHLIAYLMWGLGFVGISGMHRLYLGQYGRGVALILTFGGCGVWQLIDVATINERIALLNGDRAPDKDEANQPRQEKLVKPSRPPPAVPSQEAPAPLSKHHLHFEFNLSNGGRTAP